MKSKKFNLQSIEVKSFVTGMDSKDSETLKAGATTPVCTIGPACNTHANICTFGGCRD